ncbi:MAG: hypothetical protein RLZZ502_593 [Pseudomonadota bacterium]
MISFIGIVDVAVALAAYLLGSLSFAVIVSRAMGLPDPHTYGSGNPGATNVLRSGSKKAAVVTLLLDCLKGVLAVLLARQIPGVSELGLALAALAVFLGHLYPVFYGFAGGKGVATALGVLLAVHLGLAAVVLLVFIVLVGLSRMVSAASVGAALTAFPAAYWLLGDRPVTWAMIPLGVLLVYRHRGNLQKILAGTENKLGHKK